MVWGMPNFGSQRTEKLLTVLSYDTVYGIFVKSVCVVEEKEGVLLDLDHYLDLFGVFQNHY